MDINFEMYKFFYQVAKTGSFSEAASQLYVSQSAVSQTIRNLENKMGCRLFNRKSRATTLTSQGEMLFKYVEQAYHFLKTAESKVLEINNLQLGEIRIGVSDTICKYYLIPYLEKFHQQYPGIKIKVINRTSKQIIEIIKNGIADIGIVTLPLLDESIKIDFFRKIENVFVASLKFCQLNKKKICLEEINRYPLLMFPKSSLTRQNIELFFKGHSIDVTPEIELESNDLLVEFSRIGLGVAYVLKESALDAVNSGDLFIIDTEQEIPPMDLGIITVKEVPHSYAMYEFIRLLKA